MLSSAPVSQAATDEMFKTRDGSSAVAPLASSSVNLAQKPNISPWPEPGNKVAHATVTVKCMTSGLLGWLKADISLTVKDGLDVQGHNAIPSFLFWDIIVRGTPSNTRVINENIYPRLLFLD